MCWNNSNCSQRKEIKCVYFHLRIPTPFKDSKFPLFIIRGHENYPLQHSEISSCPEYFAFKSFAHSKVHKSFTAQIFFMVETFCTFILPATNNMKKQNFKILISKSSTYKFFEWYEAFLKLHKLFFTLHKHFFNIQEHIFWNMWRVFLNVTNIFLSGT